MKAIGMVEDTVSKRLIRALIANEAIAATITLSVSEEMNIPIAQKAEPSKAIPKTFPIITLQSGVVIKERAIPSIMYEQRQNANIRRAERNFERTIPAILTGAVRSACSVFCLLSSAKSLIVMSGITKRTIKNIL